VFDGTKKSPYQGDDSTHPLGVYGTTKWQGEQAVKQFCNNFYILRTAWVYSQFGANFMKTMLRLAAERSELSIVSDQIGTPTNAVDLAKAIVSCILYDTTTENPSYGIYHYSNEGQCSWYDFAVAIFKLKGVTIPVHSIPTAQFPTPAKRPAYSVLDKSKIKKVMKLTIPEWQDSLRALLT
jgi:dTDP-4-dehydrorhamnose reductase